MSEQTFKAFSAVLCLSLMISVSAAAQPQPQPSSSAPARPTQEISDPIEPVNRVIFVFNDFLDRILIEPVAKGYNFILPQLVRDGVQNFMRNLKSPIIVGNDLLQGRVGDAGVATARFVINTTIGVAGVADVASTKGLKYKNADLGQTLATWGVGNGFYLVLPILGPSSLRDAGGDFADAYVDPVRLYAYNTHRMWIYYTREGIEGLDDRSRLIRPIDDMRANSLDYYAAARSAWTQHRNSFINGESADDSLGNAAASANNTDHP
jgi:phospholipid-binding lipoprotein MlaA